MDSKRLMFNDQWLDSLRYPEFVGWLGKGTDKYHAYCNVCKISFDLGTSGYQAVVCHEKEPVHVKMIKTKLYSINKHSHNNGTFNGQTYNKNTLQTDVVKDKKDSITTCQSSLPTSKPSYISQVKITPGVRSVESLCSKKDVTASEVLWTLNLISNKISTHSFAGLGELFKSMFPDSTIASKFNMDKTKCSYIINHGLGPYFDSVLRNRLKCCNDIVICFDQSQNKTVNNSQMDLFVRFFDNGTRRICTEYFNSIFLKETKASAILDSFNCGIQSLSKKNILHVSMDGSDMNFTFLKKLELDIKNKCCEGKTLIDIGICGFYVFRGAIKTGLQTVNWDLFYFIQNLHSIFNYSTALRAEFTSFLGKDVFSVKQDISESFEDISAVERTLIIFDDLKKFLKYKESLGTVGLLENISNQISDRSIKCKLAFTKTLLMECDQFLQKYQTSEPLSPFLLTDCQSLVKSLLTRFVEPSKLAVSGNLLSINIRDPENLCDVKDINIGEQAQQILESISLDESVYLAFKLECQKMLIVITEKIIQRCPLKFKAVQGLSSLDPNILFQHSELGILRFKSIVEVLCVNNRITEHVADRAKSQYVLLCNEAHNLYRKKFETYMQGDCKVRLDDFYGDILGDKKCLKYSELYKVIIICLLFSHSNASVASEFSVNMDLTVENMQELSVVAQMKVFNALKYFGGVNKVPITDEMLLCVTNALKYYEDHKKRSKCFKDNEIKKGKSSGRVRRVLEKKKT